MKLYNQKHQQGYTLVLMLQSLTTPSSRCALLQRVVLFIWTFSVTVVIKK